MPHPLFSSPRRIPPEHRTTFYHSDDPPEGNIPLRRWPNYVRARAPPTPRMWSWSASFNNGPSAFLVDRPDCLLAVTTAQQEHPFFLTGLFNTGQPGSQLLVAYTGLHPTTTDSAPWRRAQDPQHLTTTAAVGSVSSFLCAALAPFSLTSGRGLRTTCLSVGRH